LQNNSIQATKLLPPLFERVDEGQLITVFHVGPALTDTVNFFSAYRCKLHFVDVFSELPVEELEDSPTSLTSRFQELLELPEHVQFDICLFWDIFNYLNSDAIHAFLTTLRPHLREGSLAHAFSVHNLKAHAGGHLYGIRQTNALSCKERPAALPGYAPHSQRELTDALNCFRIERSVLLPDSRLELLLSVK
jgi:hypothetical protein